MADMFDILRVSLFTGEDVPVTEWKPIFEEMKQQTVAALPGEWLSSHIDAPSWSLFCMSSQAQWIRVQHAQDELLQLLEANDIPCVILKGAAAAMAYPRPTLRTMGDVDFLVKRSDFEKASALLEENGYVLTHEKDFVSHHYGCAKNHIPIPRQIDTSTRWAQAEPQNAWVRYRWVQTLKRLCIQSENERIFRKKEKALKKICSQQVIRTDTLPGWAFLHCRSRRASEKQMHPRHYCSFVICRMTGK